MLSSIIHSFFYFLSFLFLASFQIHSSPDHVDPNDPHISDLLVSHYDCSKQHNLRQFSLTRVQPCAQAPSAFESTRAIVDVFVRAKAKRLKAWTCEAYVKREKFVCAQSDYKYRRHDRTDYHQNTMERPRTLDPTECKHAIRHLNGTNNPQLDAFNYSNSFTFFNDIQKQRLLETKQPPFRITKLNTFHYGAFAWISNSQLVLNSTLKEKAVCWDRYEYIIEKDSWSLIVKEIEITYDDKDNKLIYHGHTLPCLHDDGFCKPTILTPFTIVWFPEDLCLIFSIHSFIGRMSKLNNRYWLETEHFFNNHSSTTSTDTPYHDTKSQTRLSRFEIFPENKMFCNKPTPLHLTQYPDLFITYKEGFNMQTGKPNPLQLPQNEQYNQLTTQLISGKLIHTQNKFLFPALNSSNNFATIDYEAHINTKIDYSINHVFKSMSVAELNTLHTICEVERTQLLTILAMSVKNPQLAGFLLTQNRSNFLYVEGSTAWLYDCPHHLSPLYIADQCYDKIPVNYLDTVMYVDPITRQTFEYANQIPCENNPQNVISLDPDTDQYYVLTPQPIKKDPPLLFEPTQIQTAISPNTFTAQDAGIYSQKELKHFWNRVLFTKHSDNTLQLLGKAISYEFMNQQSDHAFPDNPYRSLRIGLHDYMFNLTPFFSPDWFTDAFIKLFGYPCYILTQCGIYFSTALFLQFAFNTLFSIYRSFTVRNLLKKQISVITALGFGFFGTITQTMMTAMIKSSNSPSDPNDSDSPHSPLAKTHTLSPIPKPRPPKYHTNIKTKLLNLKNKTPMQRFSPNSSPSKPISSSPLPHPTPPNTEDHLLPPPHYNSHLSSHNNLSPRPPPIPSLTSSLYLHNSPPPDDTNCDNSSNDSPIHNLWQSTKLYPPTPPPIKTNDIPLTSVNNIFDPSDSPVKVYSSCRFPPE